MVRKCDIHVIPVLFGLYLFAFVDRINIGNAKIQGLQQELHMSGTQYNVALLTFFPTYVLLEIPANLLMRRIRPSTWLSGLMFMFGRDSRVVRTSCLANQLLKASSPCARASRAVMEVSSHVALF